MKNKLYIILAVIVTACSQEDVIPRPLFERVILYQAPTDDRYAQGMDIINGTVFQAFSDGTIDVYDLSSKAYLQTIGPLKNDNGVVLHMNDISFRQENSKTYLIIPNDGINRSAYVYVISEDGGKYLMGDRIRIPSPKMDGSKYKAATQFFGKSDYCIQVAYERIENNGFGDIVVESYSFDSISPSIQFKNKWIVSYPRLWAMQGAWLDDYYCYMAVGVGSGEAKIYKIAAQDGAISCFIDFRKDEDLLPNEEIQGVSYYNNAFYFSTTYGLYKLL